MKYLRISVVSLLLLLTIACGSYGVRADSCNIKLVNAMHDRVIYSVYVSSTSSNYWGQDQLDPDEVIYPGQSLTIHQIPDGTWDIKVTGAQGDIIAVKRGVSLSNGSTFTWIIADP